MLLKQRETIEVVTGDEVSGYVYAYMAAGGERVQEWVLFENFAYPSETPMTLRAVTQPEWQQDSLGGFVAQMERTRQSGQDWLFARARATEIDDPRQIDGGPPGQCLLIRAGTETVGFVCALGKAPQKQLSGPFGSVVEHWFFYDNFVPAPMGKIRVGCEYVSIPTDPVVRVMEATNTYSRYDQAIARLQGAVRTVA